MTTKKSRRPRVIRKPFELVVPEFQLRPLLHPLTGEVIREALVDRVDREDADNPNHRITGYHRVDNLRRLVNRGNTILPHHYEAGDRYRKDWEVSHHSGVPARDYEKVYGVGGSTQPPMRQATALTKWRAAEKYVGETLVPILRHVALENRTIKDWSQEQGVNPAIALGRLSAALDRLYEFYQTK